MNGVELLRSGLAKIEAGWVQGVLCKVVNGKVCYCVLGALGETSNASTEVEDRAIGLLWQALPKYARLFGSEPMVSDVWHFNDSLECTQQEAIKLYERAIVIAEGKRDETA